MLGTALYYPTIDIQDGAWLRSAVLFWDEIQTIVPSVIEQPYKNPDAKICQKEGYLSPLHCDLYEDVLSDLGNRVLKFLDRSDWAQHAARQLSGPVVYSLIHADKIRYMLEDEVHDAVGIHPAKMPPELRSILSGPMGFQLLSRGKIDPHVMDILEDMQFGRMHSRKFGRMHIRKLADRLRRVMPYHRDDDWILVDRRFGEIYMSSLAGLLSKELAISPLTNQEIYSGVNLRYLGDDITSDSPSAARGALVSVVMEGLQVDPDIPIQKILKFRSKRKDQLANLSGQFDELKNAIARSEEGVDISENACRIYENKIRTDLGRLKDELKKESIESAWSGFQTASTFSAAPSAALWATGFEAPVVLGTSAFITAAGIGIKSYLARSKARSQSPYTYLLDVERKFSLP